MRRGADRARSRLTIMHALLLACQHIADRQEGNSENLASELLEGFLHQANVIEAATNGSGKD
jgi:hypothetical protein